MGITDRKSLGKNIIIIKGGYAKIYEGLASEAFDFLTGAYTKSIKIKNRKKNKLWEDLKNANEFPCCAGTITTDYLGFFDGFSNTGLQGGHDYTILEVNEENGRTVKIRDPYGEKKRGILTITFKEFSCSAGIIAGKPPVSCYILYFFAILRYFSSLESLHFK